MTEATVRIIGHHLPGRTGNGHRNVHLGVQHRTDVIDLIAADAEHAEFAVTLSVLVDPVTGVDFRGPYAQGKRGQRFIYLCWGDVNEAGTFTMFRRAKLNLFTLPEHIAGALGHGRTVSAELNLTDKNGGPLCASIPPGAITWRIEQPGS